MSTQVSARDQEIRPTRSSCHLASHLCVRTALKIFINVALSHVYSSNRTRSVRRLRTPEMIAKLEQRAQYQEALEACANRAYRSFLNEIAQKHYAILRDAVNKLAVADCLCSLALVAVQEGYVRPEFVSDSSDSCGERTLEIVEGRHPMIEKLRDEPFMPNTIRMHRQGHKIITGPNMGGKSSTVRMIALCSIVSTL